jgi:putative membrane protein
MQTEQGGQSEVEVWLPIVNTGLIAVSGVAAAVGYTCIRLRKIEAHKWAMLTATAFAAAFLVVYVARYLLLGSKLFAGEGFMRVVYFTVLISHTILATVLGPLVLVTIYRALTWQFRRHRRLARVTLPVWLYVAVSGWVIYLMLYAL